MGGCCVKGERKGGSRASGSGTHTPDYKPTSTLISRPMTPAPFSYSERETRRQQRGSSFDSPTSPGTDNQQIDDVVERIRRVMQSPDWTGPDDADANARASGGGSNRYLDKYGVGAPAAAAPAPGAVSVQDVHVKLDEPAAEPTGDFGAGTAGALRAQLALQAKSPAPTSPAGRNRPAAAAASEQRQQQRALTSSGVVTLLDDADEDEMMSLDADATPPTPAPTTGLDSPARLPAEERQRRLELQRAADEDERRRDEARRKAEEERRKRDEEELKRKQEERRKKLEESRRLDEERLRRLEEERVRELERQRKLEEERRRREEEERLRREQEELEQRRQAEEQLRRELQEKERREAEEEARLAAEAKERERLRIENELREAFERERRELEQRKEQKRREKREREEREERERRERDELHQRQLQLERERREKEEAERRAREEELQRQLEQERRQREEQERLERQLREQQEAERRAREEQLRLELERERKAREEQERLEREQREREEQLKAELEQQRRAHEEAERRERERREAEERAERDRLEQLRLQYEREARERERQERERIEFLRAEQEALEQQRRVELERQYREEVERTREEERRRREEQERRDREEKEALQAKVEQERLEAERRAQEELAKRERENAKLKMELELAKQKERAEKEKERLEAEAERQRRELAQAERLALETRTSTLRMFKEDAVASLNQHSQVLLGDADVSAAMLEQARTALEQSQAEVEREAARTADKLRHLHQLDVALAGLADAKHEIAEQRRYLEGECDELQQTVNEFVAQRAQLQQSVQGVEQRLQQLQAELTDLRSLPGDLAHVRDELNRQRHSTEAELQSLRARLARADAKLSDIEFLQAECAQFLQEIDERLPEFMLEPSGHERAPEVNHNQLLLQQEAQTLQTELKRLAAWLEDVTLAKLELNTARLKLEAEIGSTPEPPIALPEGFNGDAQQASQLIVLQAHEWTEMRKYQLGLRFEALRKQFDERLGTTVAKRNIGQLQQRIQAAAGRVRDSQRLENEVQTHVQHWLAWCEQETAACSEMEELNRKVEESVSHLRQRLEADSETEALEEMASRAAHIQYQAKKGDTIDAMISDYFNSITNVEADLIPHNFERVGDGVYQFGTRRITAQIIAGNLVVRVGGGFMKFPEFVQKYGKIESEKIIRLEGGAPRLSLVRKGMTLALAAQGLDRDGSVPPPSKGASQPAWTSAKPKSMSRAGSSSSTGSTPASNGRSLQPSGSSGSSAGSQQQQQTRQQRAVTAAPAPQSAPRTPPMGAQRPGSAGSRLGTDRSSPQAPTLGVTVTKSPSQGASAGAAAAPPSRIPMPRSRSHTSVL